MEETKNCETTEDRINGVSKYWCENWRQELLRGGLRDFSEPKYLALNLATALAGFVVVFGLAYLLPAIARGYWRWLNT